MSPRKIWGKPTACVAPQLRNHCWKRLECNMNSEKLQIETFSSLSEHYVGRHDHKLCSIYYILRSHHKNSPSVSLQTSVETLSTTLDVSTKTAYRYMQKIDHPFWIRTGKTITLTPIHKVFAKLGMPYCNNIKYVPLENFRKVSTRALLYQDTLCAGVYPIFDKVGRLPTKWIDGKPESNTQDEVVLKRKMAPPIARSTIKKRMGLDKSTQLRLQRELLQHAALTKVYIEHNFNYLCKLTEEQFIILYTVLLTPNDFIQHLAEEYEERTGKELNFNKLNRNEWEWFFELINYEKLGERYKLERCKDNTYWLKEQISNSYYDLTPTASKNKRRKLNQRIRKALFGTSKEKVILCERKHPYSFSEDRIEQNHRTRTHFHGSVSNGRFRRTGYWSRVEDGKLSPSPTIKYTQDRYFFTKRAKMDVEYEYETIPYE